MARVKGGVATKKKHRKVLNRAKGYWGGRHSLYSSATDTVNRALRYAYRDRRNLKRRMRSLWITRISAACRQHGINYSRFTQGLKVAGVGLDRKILADLAVSEPKAFAALVEAAKSSSGAPQAG
jgi:large subunit ribosomal protein L20